MQTNYWPICLSKKIIFHRGMGRLNDTFIPINHEHKVNLDCIIYD